MIEKEFDMAEAGGQVLKYQIYELVSSIKKLAIPNTECSLRLREPSGSERLRLSAVGREFGIYPVRNNAPLFCSGVRF